MLLILGCILLLVSSYWRIDFLIAESMASGLTQQFFWRLSANSYNPSKMRNSKIQYLEREMKIVQTITHQCLSHAAVCSKLLEHVAVCSKLLEHTIYSHIFLK